MLKGKKKRNILSLISALGKTTSVLMIMFSLSMFWDPAGPQESKMVSPWFPSIPASDCEGIFEFTLEGTANLQAKNLKSGNHKITIKMTSDSPDLINGQLWVDKKSNSDKGSKFDIDKTFNNCRVVTASSIAALTEQPSTGEQESSSLLNSLLNYLPD
jgi:hypothetical protein